jgi:starch phosphorylase
MPKPSLKPSQPDAAADSADLRDSILNKLTYSCGKTRTNAGLYDWYVATVLAVRDRIVDRWLASDHETEIKKKKRVYYLSVEFLI